MTTIYYETDGDLAALDGRTVAVVGYGNQGRCWALNLRDSGLDVAVCVRADATREQAQDDGFEGLDIADASGYDVICVLVPDDAIPHLGLSPRDDALTIVASGYSVAFDRFTPNGDIGLVAPRMLGPEVRRCFTEGVGFITAVGVHADRTGHALERTLAITKGIGGLRQGAIELTHHQEAVLDLGVEQVLSPALAAMNQTFLQVMIEHDIPLEAILCELFYSGEVERNYRLLREVGFTGQLQFHSPASQYGQLSRRGRFDHLAIAETMRELADHIASGAFADEWDAECADGNPALTQLRDQHAGPFIAEFEADLRQRLGEGISS